MILEGVRVKEPCSGPVGQNQAVGGGAVVIAGGKALIVEPSGSACGQDHGLGPCDEQFPGLHILQHCTGAAALLVQQQLNGGGVIHHGNFPVQDLVPDGPHDLRTGVVLGSVHPLPGGAAAVGGNHGAVGSLVELHAQIAEPADGVRGLVDQLVQQVLLGGKVTAAVGIEKMLSGAVAGLVGGLDAALGHHGVGIAHAQLGDDHHGGSVVVGLNGCRSACAAAADDENVGGIVRPGKVNADPFQTGLALQKLRQFQGNLFALVGAGQQGGKLGFPVVGMIGFQQSVLFLGAHAGRVQPDIGFPCSFDFFQ